MIKNKIIISTVASVFLTGVASADVNSMVENVLTGWTGDVEAGASISSGNTEKQVMRFGLNLNKEGEENAWGHTVKATANSSTENDIRSEEEYRLSGQSRYNISATDYTFAELDYVNDRFSGFQYRISEGIGYGRKFYDTETLRIAGEVSVGGRHTLDTLDEKTNSALAKVSGKVNWDINENIEFVEDLSVSFADSTIILSDTAVKSKLSENLYLKFGVTIEHNSDVPSKTEKTDTLTSFSLGYKF